MRIGWWRSWRRDSPDLQADLRRLTIEYAEMRQRALQQKRALLTEALVYHADREMQVH